MGPAEYWPLLLQHLPRHTRLLHLHEALRLMFQGRQLIGKQPAAPPATASPSEGKHAEPRDEAAPGKDEEAATGDFEILSEQQTGTLFQRDRSLRNLL